jgi:ABC-type uncharacterized transport system substrate-binding protein
MDDIQPRNEGDIFVTSKLCNSALNYGRKAALVAMLCWGATGMAVPAKAHPHVFVDGGIDFVIDGDSRLQAVHVTWLYDEFETLYMLSSYGISLNSDGGLDEADRLELIRLRSQWPQDFNGSAHLTVQGASIPLEWPQDLDADVIDGRLELTFKRNLKSPILVKNAPVTAAFYESTYFFAFSITNQPNMIGPSEHCSKELIPYEPAHHSQSLQAALALLSREETPVLPNVGAEFADRIVLKCD